MREIATTFAEGFTKGLRPWGYAPRNADVLVGCHNVVPDPTGLRPRPEIVSPFPDEFISDWPFPVYHKLMTHTFVITRTALYIVDALSELMQVALIAWNDLPHVTDFGPVVYFSDTHHTYVYAEGRLTNMRYGDLYFATSCSYKGQMFVGNGQLPAGKGLVVNADTEAVNRYEVHDGATTLRGTTLVGWSKICNASFEFDLGNEAGYAHLPWQGNVLKLLQLDDDIVVYGDNGLAKLQPYSSPINSFGLYPFSSHGIVNRNAVAGDSRMHVFVGTDYNLYALQKRRAMSTDGESVVRLGYAEYLKDLTDIVVTYDQRNNFWWIAGREKAYVFHTAGLFSVSVGIAAVATDRLDLTAFPHVLGNDSGWITTETQSFGTRGIKLLTAIELDTQSDALITCAIDTRVDYKQPFFRTNAIPIDPRGFVFPMTSGTEFRVHVETADYRNFTLSSLRLRYKTTDRTPTRGVVNAGSPE